MRADQVEEAWKVVTPILETWSKEPAPRFPNYAPGSWGPKAAEELIHGQDCEWTLLPENGIIKTGIKKAKEL
jgi:glucose-6-phosphate 1-dehydrogenase